MAQDGGDGARLMRLQADLEGGGTDAATRLFQSVKARAPHIVWAPEADDAGHPVLRAFLKHCRGLQGPDGMIRASALALPRDDALARWLMVLRPLADGHFRYEVYGAGIAAHYGRDMTGATTHDFPAHISLFFTALYRAAGVRGLMALSVHEPPDRVFVRSWRRLMAPVYDDDGAFWGVIAANIADNDLRAGLEALPDPVMVCREDGVILFANAAATALFGERPFAAGGVAFLDYTGLPVDFGPVGPGDGPFAQSRHVGEIGGLIVHFEVTRSALTYRDSRLVLVVVKPT